MSDSDLTALIAAARAGAAAPDTALAEPSADQWENRARAQIWQAGRVLATAEALSDTPADAARLAASRAAAALQPEADPAHCALAVEAVDAVERIEPEGLSGLIAATTPGLHGLLLHDSESGRRAGGWPADALQTVATESARTAAARGGAAWVKTLLREVRPPGTRLAASIEVQRFTTIYAAAPMIATPSAEATPENPIAEMSVPASIHVRGGVRVVEQSELSRDQLVESATRAGAWLVQHQQPNGLFHYEFQPNTQTWSRADSLVRQAGCLWAVAALTRINPRSGFTHAATGAVNSIFNRRLHCGGPGGLAYLENPHSNVRRLGAIPLLLLALSDLEPLIRIDAKIPERLTATLLALQTRNGRFGLTARGLNFEGSERYYGGQITLALVRRYAATKRSRLARAVERAVHGYRAWWNDSPDNPDLSFAAWMLQACDIWDAFHPDSTEAAAFAQEMADWVVPQQHGPDAPNPLWPGGFGPTPGIDTAAYTEGLVHALALARRHQNDAQIARYRRSVLLAMRFLLQLSVTPTDLPFIGGEEHRGAVRSSLRRRDLRCDNAQHFIMAALGAATQIQPEEYGIDITTVPATAAAS